MDKSQQFASIVGPTLIALGITEGLNMHIFMEQTGPIVFLNGLILFVAGLCIARFHNVWTRNWKVLITLTGWLVMLAGLYRMVYPVGPQAEATTGTYIMLTVIAAIGVLLTTKGYARQRS